MSNIIITFAVRRRLVGLFHLISRWSSLRPSGLNGGLEVESIGANLVAEKHASERVRPNPKSAKKRQDMEGQLQRQEMEGLERVKDSMKSEK